MNEFIFKSTPETDRILKEMIGNRIEKIVRCKDCKYWNRLDTVKMCTRTMPAMRMTEDDFCSRGEHK